MNRRRKKIIRLDVQLRVVLVALGVACLVLLINFFMTYSCLADSNAKVQNGENPLLVLEAMRYDFIGRFLVSIGLAISGALIFGIIQSFKFAGPIYRLEQFFKDLKDGPWDERCTFRQTDDLQDLSATINEALDGIRAFLRENQRLLAEVQSLLDRGGQADDAAQASLRLRERLAAALSVYRERLQGLRIPGGASGNSLEKAPGEKSLEAQT